MFGRKKDPRGTAASVVPKIVDVPEPKPIPQASMWRVEMTDGYRTVEAHQYVKGDRYVTFVRWTGSHWKSNEWLGLSTVTWRHEWVTEVVCELNNDYVMSIEESI